MHVYIYTRLHAVRFLNYFAVVAMSGQDLLAWW